jgi:hypothetical protein
MRVSFMGILLSQRMELALDLMENTSGGII